MFGVLDVERLAQAALALARFTEPGIAAGVLRQAQILASTVTLARLDYSTAEHAHAALAGLIASVRYAVAPPRALAPTLTASVRPADLQAEGYASLFARAYLTWQ